MNWNENCELIAALGDDGFDAKCFNNSCFTQVLESLPCCTEDCDDDNNEGADEITDDIDDDDNELDVDDVDDGLWVAN